jgi:hypothetical protein
VKTLVSGPGVFICDECVQLCQSIIAKNAATQSPQEKPSPLLPDNAPTENLLQTLRGYNGAFESIDRGMQDIVDILGELGHDRANTCRVAAGGLEAVRMSGL